ncbi:MAG: hypothetical protein MPJ50_11020 [Pirellulales bacterium]|nr:hypothetical protein [Pirellulales bacterium]
MSLPLLPLILSDVSPGLAQALEQEGVPFRRVDQCAGEIAGHPNGRFVLFDSRRESTPSLLPGQQAIDIAACDASDDGCPPTSLCDRLLNTTSVRRSWDLKELSPEECVARFDKRAERRRLLTRLREKIESLGGVWLTISPVPAGFRGAFCLRIDYDEVASGDVARFLDVIDGCQNATSHYLCGRAYEDQTDVHARLQGLHVGGHGYWHHTYANAAENLHNVARGMDALQRAGLDPDGFVAPHGRFNEGLLHSLEQLGISHSSEFSLAFDDRPFLPTTQSGEASSVLQIPVHPISLGVLLEAATGCGQSAEHAVEIATRHFTTWLEANFQAGEPVLLYGHPERRLGRYPELVREILRAADAIPGLWRMNMRDFCAWWRTRAAVSLQVDPCAAGIRVRRLSPSGPWVPAVDLWLGDHVAPVAIDAPDIVIDHRSFPKTRNNRQQEVVPREFASPNNPFLDNSLSGRKIVRPTFQTRPQPPCLAGTTLPQAFSLRQAVKQFIDWERDTPVTELQVRNVRQLLKKSLRYAFPDP